MYLHFVDNMQAAEQGHYDVAVLLVTRSPDVVSARDRREQLALDLVKAHDDKWSLLFKSD